MKKLSWKPRRRGEIYCAPACGGKCTYAQFVAAEAVTAALVAQLGGAKAGWAPRVHENLGWYAVAVNKRRYLAVHVYGDTYSVFFGPDAATSGGGRWVADGKNLAKAIKTVVKQAKAEAAAILTILKNNP